ncbi:MAG: hypothetical protein K2M79_07210 [Muribaculaceae bacterium]|nr:hypothetical protein [Muribaculaceae bacterium]
MAQENASNNVNHAGDNKRIARNTLFLYIRLFITMGITVYTSRIVLEALGVVDYGIYNVVAGISYSFFFFTVALTTTTQRFLSMAEAKGDAVQMRRVFSICLYTFTALSVLVLIVGFSAGDWLVRRFLSIPEDRVSDAVMVLFTTVAGLSIYLISPVYEAVLIAREDMKSFAYLGIMEAVAKLCVAYLVIILPHKLIMFSVLTILALVVPRLYIAHICYKRYPESHPLQYWSWKMAREIFVFSGLNIYISVTWVVVEQFVNIAINIFFGAAVNAARGVTAYVNNAIANLCLNFSSATRPQIIKSFTSGERDYAVTLTLASSRYSSYLVTVLGVPIICSAGLVLRIWLTEIPPYTEPLLQLALVWTCFNVLHNPISDLARATSQMRKIALIANSIYLLVIPGTYFLFKAGLPPMAFYPVQIFIRVLVVLAMYHIIRNVTGVGTGSFIVRVLLPVSLVLSVDYMAGHLLYKFFAQNLWGLIAFCMIMVIVGSVITYVLGLNVEEKRFVNKKVTSMLNKCFSGKC